MFQLDRSTAKAIDQLREGPLSSELVAWSIQQNAARAATMATNLAYYQNRAGISVPGTGVQGEALRARGTAGAQEAGLPARIRGGEGHSRKEIVLENDIAWRVEAGVDLLFGNAIRIESLAEDVGRARQIEQVLVGLFDASGGSSFLQRLALAGGIFGSADVLLRRRAADRRAEGAGGASGGTASVDRAVSAARGLLLDLVYQPWAVPVFHPDRQDELLAYVQHAQTQAGPPAPRTNAASTGEPRGLERLWRSCRAGDGSQALFELITPRSHIRLSNGRLSVGRVGLGRIPLVHIQHLPSPYGWDGVSEVLALRPLQDELNTRLCDRAHRITMTSFRMFLGKRIPDFIARKIGPGQMWSTDDEKASIEVFGGDSDCPSEREHIDQLREAMDKASGINPLAAGVVRDKLGNLTSGVALRVTLLGAISRTLRKRITYGRGIEQLAELALEALHAAGIFPTRPAERLTRVRWPAILPDDLERELAAARTRIELGVPREQVLADLGHASSPAHIDNDAPPPRRPLPPA